MRVEGTVAPGFEPVRRLYEHNMRTLAERNTQLCVYVGEERVVDLWASAIDDGNFSADSLVNVFSSGKSLEAIMLAVLVDRGLLDYHARIVDYWPEFGGNGKSETTVADLMRHEAGLAAFDTSLDPDDLQRENLKRNAVGAVIERQKQKYRPDPSDRREYHAITRGWIAGELFRRVEPSGRTMGQFLRDEISEPLGIDVYIGLHDHELPRINPVVPLGVAYQFRQSLIPRALGRKIELNLLQIIAKLWRLGAGVRRTTTRGAPIPIKGMNKLAFIDTPALAKGEIPSAGAKCNARGLAKLAAAMANGGGFDGRLIVGGAGHAALHGGPVQRNMMVMKTTFTQGGLATFPPSHPTDGPLDRGLNRGREGYYGWMGLGGSIFQWHPQYRIGFGYVPTSLNVLDVANERGKVYQAEVVKCVEALRT